MIKVVAKQFVKEGKLEDYLSIMKLLVEETNKKDAGCIKYELYQDAADPLTVAVIEEWETQAALDAHAESAHFHDLIPKFSDLSAKPPEINYYKKLF